MKLNVDEIINRILPWVCEITVGGQTYNVRPPTLADVDLMASLRDGKQLSQRETAQLVSSLFEHPQPDLAAMNVREFNIITNAVMGYLAEYLSKKNTETLQNEIRILKGTDDLKSSGSSQPSAQLTPASATP